MKQTNYTLFDFLDFDPALDGGDRLWKACRPTAIRETEGAVYLSIPFQQQQNSNEISPDLQVERQTYELRIQAFGTQCLRVSIAFEGEIAESSPILQIDPQLKAVALHVVCEEKRWLIVDASGLTRAVVDYKEPVIDHWSDLQPGPDETLNLQFFPDGKQEVKLNATDHFAPTRHDAFPLAMITRDGRPHRSTLSFYARPDACFYGSGERWGRLNLAGRTLQLSNQDAQGVNNRRSYKNIPFYFSSENYGVFLHTSAFVKFSLADHSTRSAQLMVEEPVIDCFLMAAEQPEKILRCYRQITGFPAMPPLWSYGVWMSRMTYFAADEVEDICARLRREDYPCDVIHLDTGWFQTDWLCEWKFNNERFPDPEAFISRLKANGFRVSLWQLPYIAYEAAQYEEAIANNYIGRTEKRIAGASNFSVQDYAGTIDFTSPAATPWYQGLLRNLLEIGVACIKTDFGEDIHTEAIYQHMMADKLHNLYPLLYQQAAYEVTREVTGEGIIWARAAWAGCQRYPLHWGGDAACSWDGLAGSLRGGLQLGLSGFAFWSHDVPGFHGVPDFMNSVIPDALYVRWTQFGVFSSHLRYHGSSKREPWHFPAIADIIRRWWKLRYYILPYIIEQSELSIQSGMPLLRALLLHHPDDPTCRHIDDQYYFGDDLLVAPVMNERGCRDIYLPEGEWVHFFSKEYFRGPVWLKQIEVPLDEMPVYVRRGAILPVYEEEVSCTDEMVSAKITKMTFK